MAIDLTGLPRIGNMISGGGLNGIFDGNAGTSGYAQSTTGYAGIDFNSAPRRIEKVEIDSQSNGYDASGLTSQVTLKLYGRNGAAPASATDGTLLGSIGPFTDVNALQTKTIVSSDQVTQYRYVWAVITTGVWAAAVSIRLFAALAPLEPVASDARRIIVHRRCDEAIALSQLETEVQPFRVTLRMNAPAVLKIHFQCNTTHNGPVTGYNGAVGIGFALYYKYAETFAGLAGAPLVFVRATGCNISERNPQHYGETPMVAAMSTLAGFYEFRMTGSAHSDGSSLNGLASILVEGGRGLNGLVLDFDKDAELVSA